MIKGKSALVTGSTNGLGYAVAKGLAIGGCNVMLHGLEPEAADRVLSYLAKAVAQPAPPSRETAEVSDA